MRAGWFDGGMTITRTAVARETDRRSRRMAMTLGEDIRRLRMDASISTARLAEAVGVDRSHLARTESGQARPSTSVLIAIGVALGADFSVRYFAGSGPRLHDRFQAAMIEAFLRALDPRWRISLEVPISSPSRGVIDIVLTDSESGITIAAEAQSELRRIEQQIRWHAEKALGLAALQGAAPAGPDVAVSRLLILRSTRATREIARQFEATLHTAYPARSDDVVTALTTPSGSWPGPGIAWMHLHGTFATLMRFPPRGVALGR
jgi:transcriptional regulator with XRE-family HTH domain